MWVADMDFTSPEPVISALEERARHGVFGYSACLEGYFHETVQWQRRRHGWNISPESIIFSPGVVPALNMLVQEFVPEGKKVIIQPPVYYPFRGAIKNNGGSILENPLREENGKYTMDLEDLAEKAADPDAVMMILCNPHNPVGRVWEEGGLKEVIRICSENGLLLVSDEIHGDLIFRGARHVPAGLASAGAASEFLITCSAPSKTFNLPGLQTAYCVIENEGLRNRYKKRLDKIGINGPNSFGAIAQEVAYRDGESWLQRVLDHIESNFQFLRKTLVSKEPRIGITVPEATYLVWLDFRFLQMEGRELQDLMRHGARVALDDGYIFGTGGEGFQRINIACSQAILREGLSRILNAVKEVTG